MLADMTGSRAWLAEIAAKSKVAARLVKKYAHTMAGILVAYAVTEQPPTGGEFPVCELARKVPLVTCSTV